jgi:hypothetical protein
MRLIITQENQVVADIPDYQGTVPRVGEHVHRPRGPQPVPGLLDGFMSVKSVVWGIIARPDDDETKHFVGAAEPFVEVIV